MNAYEGLRLIPDLQIFVKHLRIHLKQMTGQKFEITLGQSDLDIDPYQREIIVLVENENINVLLEIDVSNIPQDVFMARFFSLVISTLKNKKPHLFI